MLATYTDSSTQDITDNVIWALSNDLIASIDPEQGKITATKPGASQLVAHWRNNNIKSNTAKITVSKATLDSLHITPLSQEIIVNNTGKFEALGMYSDNSAQDLTDFVDWSSSDPNSATILQGEVLGFEEGTVQISASYNDLKAAQNVKAEKATLKIIADTFIKITVIPEFKTMAKGTTQQFNATATYGIQGDIDITKDNDTSWYSESENLTIDENALATAINKEKDIKVSAVKEGKKGTVQVNITSETIETLTIDTFIPEHTKNLTTGSQLELQAIATMTDETEQDVSSLTNWSESSGSAHLTLRGAVITAQAPGTTEISAQYQDVKAESNITIKTIERSNSSCDIPSITMSTGDTTSLTFLCPPTTKEIPSTYSLTAMGFMGPAGMQMPFVTWSVANKYCEDKGKRLPKKEELYALMQHVNSPNKKGPGLYLKYGWPMFLNYWSANKSGFNYWTVNMYSRFSWPAITNDSKVYSFSCVKDIVKK